MARAFILRDSIDLDPRPESAGSGRRFLRETLRPWAVPETAVDQAVLIATELVTNAVLHAATPLTLEVTWDPPTLRLAVRDHSTTPPVVRSYAPDSLTGRGLGVVAALGAAWGVDPLPDGKEVWAEVRDGDGDEEVEPAVASEDEVTQLVQLRGIALSAFAEMEAHHEAVLRELELSALDGGIGQQVPADLIALAREVAPTRETLTRAVEAAGRGGSDPTDLALPLRRGAIERMRRWMQAMVEVDQLARDGALLALPASTTATDAARAVRAALDHPLGAGHPATDDTGSVGTATLRDVVDRAPTPAGILTVDGRWDVVNDPMGALVGRPPAELVTMTLADVIHHDDAAAAQEALDALLLGAPAPVTMATRYLHADGREVAVTQSVIVFRDGTGIPQGFICQVQDSATPGGPASGEEDPRLADALDQVRVGHAAAARLTTRLAQLQTATSRLSEVRSTSGIASIILEELSGSIGADRACLWTVSRDGRRLHMRGSRHYDHAAVERLSDIELAADMPAAQALRLGRPVFIDSPEDRRRRFPSMAGQTDSHTSLIVPLLIEGRPIGVLSFAWRSAHHVGLEDSQVIGALSEQCAQALDRSRLFEAEQRAGRRQRFLAEASRKLAESLDFEATAAQVARLVVPELADSCSVMLVEDDGRLRAVAHAHVDPLRERILEELSDRPDVLAIRYLEEVVRTGEVMVTPVLRPDDVDLVTGDAELRRRLRALDIRSSLAVPLRARGHSVGLLGLQMSSSERQFRPGEVEVVLDLADRAAVALDNARTHQLRSELASTLQRSLLPPRLPALRGATLAARYKPAVAATEVGGDFYDVFDTGPDWALVLGDVCGKGATAAALTAMVRYSIRALAIQRRQPAVVLARLNSTMLHQRVDDERFCTAVYVRLAESALGRRVTVCSAGHPLPLLVRADGRVRKMGSPGGLLGLFDDIHLSEETAELHDGDALVLYTDGVTEAHRGDDLFGDERLVPVLAACAGRSAEAMADAVVDAVEEFTGGVARDDLAVLVLRVGG